MSKILILHEREHTCKNIELSAHWGVECNLQVHALLHNCVMHREHHCSTDVRETCTSNLVFFFINRIWNHFVNIFALMSNVLRHLVYQHYAGLIFRGTMSCWLSAFPALPIRLLPRRTHLLPTSIGDTREEWRHVVLPSYNYHSETHHYHFSSQM